MIMPSRFLNLAVSLLAFLSSPAFTRTINPETLVGKSYASARKVLIKNGWKPFSQNPMNLMDWEKRIQSKYPEFDACAGDRPVCSFSFVAKHSKCVRVITLGEELKSFTVNAIAYDCWK